MSWYDWLRGGPLLGSKPKETVLIKDLEGGADITLVTGSPGQIAQYQQQASAQHFAQIRQLTAHGQINAIGQGAPSMPPGIATGIMLDPRPYAGIPTPTPTATLPSETKTEIHDYKEPELEEVVKEDGTTVLRLKK